MLDLTVVADGSSVSLLSIRERLTKAGWSASFVSEHRLVVRNSEKEPGGDYVAIEDSPDGWMEVDTASRDEVLARLAEPKFFYLNYRSRSLLTAILTSFVEQNMFVVEDFVVRRAEDVMRNL
jgi:hypothetical protein